MQPNVNTQIHTAPNGSDSIEAQKRALKDLILRSIIKLPKDDRLEILKPYER